MTKRFWSSKNWRIKVFLPSLREYFARPFLGLFTREKVKNGPLVPFVRPAGSFAGFAGILFLVLLFSWLLGRYVFADKEGVVYIFPSVVSGEGWNGKDKVLTQELSADAAFVDFSPENSAHIGVDQDVSPQDTSVYPGTPLPTDVTPLEGEMVAPQDAPTDTLPVDTTQIAPGNDEIPEPVAAPIPSEEAIPSEEMSAFLPLRSWVLPRAFAQEMESSETSTATILSSGNSIPLDVTSDESGSTTHDVGNVGDDDVWLCRVRSVPCHVLRAEGFDLGGALNDRPFIHSALKVSLGGGSAAKGETGEIVVRFRHGHTWENLGYEKVYGTFSNQTRGGYLSFDLSQVEDWDDLRDVAFEVEYVGTGTVATPIFIDSMWIAATYEKDIVHAGDEDIIPESSHLRSALSQVDALWRKERKDTLILEDGAGVALKEVDARPDAKITVKSSTRVISALQGGYAYMSVTNDSGDEQDVRLQFHIPSGAHVSGLKEWVPRMPFTETRTRYGTVGYFCDGGWVGAGDGVYGVLSSSTDEILSENADMKNSSSTTGAGEYFCASTKETRICDVLSVDGANCNAIGEEVGLAEETSYRSGWVDVGTMSGSFRDEENIFQKALDFILAELPDHAIPDTVQPVTFVPTTITLLPDQTVYYRMEISAPLNTIGDIYVEAAAKSGAYGLLSLSWDGSWNHRFAITIDQSTLPDLGSYGLETFAVPVDLSHSPDDFWANITSSGNDLRFVSMRDDKELPFWLSSFDREGKTGLAWVRVPVDHAGTSTQIYAYYGNQQAPNVSDASSPFLTNVLAPRGVVVGGSARDMSLHVIALADGVRVVADQTATGDNTDAQLSEEVTLRRGESTIIDHVASGARLFATGPVTVTVSSVSSRAVFVPAAFTGNTFAVPPTTGASEIALTSFDNEEGSVVIETAAGTSTLDVVPDSVVSAPFEEGSTFLISSPFPTLGTIGKEDGLRTLLYPSIAKDLFGFDIDETRIAAEEDGTDFSFLCSSGPRTEIDGRRRGSLSRELSCPRGSLSAADALRVMSPTHPIGGRISSGVSESFPLLPSREFSTEYVLPFDVSSVVILCPPGPSAAEISVVDRSGMVMGTTTCAARGVYPGKALLSPSSDASGIFPMGSFVRSVGPTSTPILIMGAKTDDSIAPLFGTALGRTLSAFDPEIVFGADEFIVPGEHRLIDRTEDGTPKEHANDALLEKREFSVAEHPSFAFRYKPRTLGLLRGVKETFGIRPYTVRSVSIIHNNLGVIPVHVDIAYKEGYEWSVELSDKASRMRPGKYTLRAEIEEGGDVIVDEFDFYWGLIAINYQKSVFVPDEEVTVSLGALSNNGNTICDARLKLWITAPGSSAPDEVPVSPSGECSGNNIVSVPDYTARYIPHATGTYAVRVVRLDDNGNAASETHDSFPVVTETPLIIERSGPTRIYPLAHYTMTLRVTAQNDFSGDIVERIPADFVVIDRGGSLLERLPPADGVEEGVLGDISATWSVNLEAGHTVEFSYTFDAPDRSPYLYLLGPAEMRGSENFTEMRKWQIASDAAGKMLLYWDRSYVPTGWTCVSCTGTDAFWNRFAMGSSTYGGTGGTATHTPTASATVYSAGGTGVGPNTTNNTNNAPLGHSHTLTPQISSASNLPLYRELKVLQSNSAGDPSSIPGGAIAMFDIASSSLPSGWYRYSNLDGRYPMGQNSNGLNGGSATHFHTATGTLAAPADSGLRSQNGTANGATDVLHTHTLTATNTDVLANDPPYIEVLYAQLPATSSPSNYMITMWDNTPPDGWTNLTASGGPMEGKFLKASTTYGATGGTSAHAHADILTATTSVANDLNNYTANANNAQAPANHTHNIDINGFSTDTTLPPYVEVIIAKRLAGISLWDQRQYRWYANQNAIPLTDPWPPGGGDIDEDTPIDSGSLVAKVGDVLRLRIALAVTNATSTVGSQAFKLQYSQSSDCTTALNWDDVAAIGASGVPWRGYNNTSATDRATLPGTVLSASTVTESYTEVNNSTSTSVEIGIGAIGEWDWVIQSELPTAGAHYCFRMAKSDGTPLDTHTVYPEVVTNAAPQTPLQDTLFDNEKTGTTTPIFTFLATDGEANDLDYEIDIASTSDFAVSIVNVDSIDNPDYFENVPDPVNKAPFTAGDTISYHVSPALTNGASYWWRVRAKDVAGSNTWGPWSSARSFTVNTSVTLSTWFQTTRDQFETDGQTNVDATSTIDNDVMLLAGQTSGVLFSPQIDLDQATVGTAWGSLAFTDQETSSDLKYQVQYLDATSTWVNIPDSALSGNAAGFDTSPVSLLSVDPTIYTTIRLRANFTHSGASPRLFDWTLTWDFKVTTPVITVPFDNAKVATTTPYFDFSATDPNGDPLTYQISWSTDPTFSASTTKTSDLDTGFTNITQSDSDPFFEGDTIRYTIPFGIPLTNGTTYYYRVRAKDPLPGANDWSFWSNTRSLTVDTSITVATWFQTTNTQFTTDTLTSLYTYGSGGVTVSTTTNEAMVAYGESGSLYPRYRIWNGSSWGGENSALSIGSTALYWSVLKASPVYGEYILATLGADRDINLQVYNDGAWGNLFEITGNAPNVNRRSIDVAYETISGRALAVACDGDADPSYSTWDGDDWSAVQTIDMGSANNCEWIKLASNPISNEIILLERNTGNLYQGAVWNATTSTWGAGDMMNMGSMSEIAHEGMALEYEDGGYEALAISSNAGAQSFIAKSWKNGAWSASTTVTIGDDFEWGTLARDKGTDRLHLCYIDEDGDMGVKRWDGGGWTSTTTVAAGQERETAPTLADNEGRSFDCVFEDTTARNGYTMLAYSDLGGTRYQSMDTAFAWSAELQIMPILRTFTDQLRRAADNTVLGIFFDHLNGELYTSSWNGSVWSATSSIESTPSVTASPFGEPFMIAPKNPATRGTIVGTEIDFDDGLAPAWDQVLWSVTTPGLSTFTVQVEYYDTASSTWRLIPDADLAQNSTGTSTSPINIRNIDTTTYNQIRLVGNLTCVLGNCPTLNDWTVKWAAGVDISGNARLHDLTTPVTSGTVRIAVNGTLQPGTGTINAAGNWTISNVTVFPGNVMTVYITGAANQDEAVAVAKYGGSGNMGGVTLNARWLTIGSASNTDQTYTNSDISLYDYSASGNNEDIFHDVTAGGDFLSCATGLAGCADAGVDVLAANVFRPNTGTGKTITTYDLRIDGTVYGDANTVKVTGNWDNNNSFVANLSTVVMNGTSSWKSIDSTGAGTSTFYNLTIGESGSLATFSASSSLVATGTMSVSYGTFSPNTQTVTLQGDLTIGSSGTWTKGTATTTFSGTTAKTWTDSTASKQDIGNILIDGTAKTLSLGSSVKATHVTIGSDDTLDAGSGVNGTITVLGSWINNGTFTARSGTVAMAATTTGRILTIGNSDFYNLSFTGVGGGWSFTAGSATATNDLSIATGTVTLPAGTMAVSGSYDNTGGVVNANSGTLRLYGSGSGKNLRMGTSSPLNTIDIVGSGSWVVMDANATTTWNVTVAAGTLTLPPGTFAVDGSFQNTGGTVSANGGTLKMTSASGSRTIRFGGSALSHLLVSGGADFTISDTSATTTGNMTLSNGTTTLPSTLLAVGGDFTNAAKFLANGGTVRFAPTSGTKTVTPGNSSFTHLEVRGTGSLTIAGHATTTGTFVLTNANVFTLSSGKALSVGGSFTTLLGGASTTWTGSILSLDSGTSFSPNTKTAPSDAYGELRLAAGTNIRIWNATSTIYNVNSSASIYSQDHNGTDGDLYIFGNYQRTSGTDWWNYATDFDGTALGGSSRQVRVRLASGAAITFTGGTLQMIGAAAATTSVDRQSTGSYAFSLTDTTINASYYSVRNTGSAGLQLLGASTVTSLDDGAFILDAAGGTSMTVAAATINANPALQIYRVGFDLAAVSGFNVTESGAPTSYWRFHNHYGNRDGEAYDSDPSGDPGEIRWDDSNFIISISGTVYNSNLAPMGSPTCDGATPVVRVKVNGTGNFAASCASADGTFTVPGVTFSGDTVMTIYLDTGGGAKAVTVTRSAVSDLSGIKLYQNRLVITHEDVTPITISDLASFDTDGDPDVFFQATTTPSTSLVVEPEKEFWVWSGKTFVPGGNVTLQSGGSGATYDGTLHIDANATFTAAGTQSHSVGGRFVADSGATFTPASSTFTFTATTSGKAIMASSSLSFWNVVLNGSGGNWSVNQNITVGNDLTVTAGTLSGASNVTVDGNASGNGTVAMTGGTFSLTHGGTFGGTADWSFSGLTFGNGTVGTTTKTGSSTVTVSGTLTVASNHVWVAGGSSVWIFTGSGSVFSLSGTWDPETTIVRYAGTSNQTITATRYHRLWIAPTGAGGPTDTIGSGTLTTDNGLIVGDGTNAVTVTANTNDPTIQVRGDLTIRSSGTFTASDSGTLTLYRDYLNAGTFTHSSGTITFAATTTGRTIVPGNSSFGSATFNSSSGGWTITGNATTSQNLTLTAASSFTLASGTTFEVDGTFTNGVGGGATTFTGSTLYLNGANAFTINTSSTGNDTYATLEIGVNTKVRAWNSSAATTMVAGSGSLYSQDHAGVDGDLYIWGSYTRSSGNDYWAYATDFDGTALGGSARQVNVRLASGASFTLSGGAIDISGTTTATTTIDRQGTSGNYALTFSGGNATGTYMSIRNADTNGMSFSGSVTVNTLSYSDFELGVNGGSMITVAGGVIDANPLKIFMQDRFATSTGISSGYNVKATGSSASVWRFNLHYGNYAGEAYDSDPGGDPGYIIWDDSAAQITISGNVYADEGSTPIGGPTCNGVTQNVRLKVQGAGSYASACNAGTGAFSIPNVIFNPGDTLTLYLDTNGGAKAANISLDPVSNITNMHLYQDRVIVRHEQGNPQTIVAMNQYDMDQDGDIPFRASTGPTALTLNAGTELYVWASKVFAPGGNVTVYGNASANFWDGSVKLADGAVWSSASGQSHSIAGSFYAASGASLAPSDSTMTFTATTTGKSIAASSSLSFASLVFSGIGGGWDVSGVGTTSGDFTVATGTLTLPAGTLALAGSYDNTGGIVNANGGTLRLYGTASGKNLRMGTSSPLHAIDIVGSGGSWTVMDANGTTTGTVALTAGTLTLPSGTFAVDGSFTNNGGVITANGGTVKLTGASTRTLTTGGSSLASLLIAGPATVTWSDTAATTTGDIILRDGTLILPTGTLSVGGGIDNNRGAFTSGAGTVILSPSSGTKTVSVATSTFRNLEVRGTGSITIAAHATTTAAFTLTNVNIFTLASGQSLAVGGAFSTSLGGASTTWTGSTLSLNSGTSFSPNIKTTPADAYGELRLSSGTNIRIWNSTSTIYTLATSSSIYSQDHNGTDGSLYIFGDYQRTSGTDWWNYATDFDGTTLTGGSRRAVSVRFASNATTSVTTNGTLEVVGAAGASTTIDRQGTTGNYTLSLLDANINAAYFSIRNTDKSGLQLLGTSTILGFSDGDFELGLSGGTTLTFGSTTVAQNASQQYFTFRFATSTGVSSGSNIRLTGTTSNAITIRTTNGNYAGEVYDEDGLSNDACGSIRWDDSSCLFVDEQHVRWRNDDGGEGVPSSEWFNASWSRRKHIRVTNNSSTAVTNAQVKVDIPYDADMQSDFDDLRFTDSSGTTPVPFWLASYSASATGTVWVKVPSLPASGVADLYVYYGNGSATSLSSGTTTFTFFDDFEDNDISDYTGDTSLFAARTAFNYERSYGLGASVGNEGQKTTDGIGRTDVTVSRDATIRFMQYIDMSSGASNEPCFLFGVTGSFTSNQNYGVCLQPFGSDKVVIAQNVSNNGRNDGSTLLATKSVTYTTGWYETVIDWISAGNAINVSVYDSTGALFASTSTVSSAYTSGGIGFSFWGQHGGWDIVRAGAYIPATPSTAIGLEEVSGGASWKVAEDTSLIDQLPNQNVRLRMTIKNSGTPITEQNFRLQSASKGVAPNCEAVPTANYSDVPAASSGCGSAVACMSASSQFANRSATSRLLSLAQGFSFTSGQIMEDPSNDTSDLDIAANYVTEVEYNFQMTAYATGDRYCFRAVNGTIPLDNYSKVAELKMLHAPSISDWAFNGGNHLALTEGTTTYISATGTVTDYNGYGDLLYASSTDFRSSFAGGRYCSADANACYQIATTSCAFSSCAGNSCVLTCTAAFQYYADPTDTGSIYQNDVWDSFVDVWDQSYTHGTASATREVYTVRGISIPAAIDYGDVTVGFDTGAVNASTTVVNTGNAILDLSLSGSDMTSGASSIPVANQKYATSTFTYSTCLLDCSLLSSTPSSYDTNIPKATSSNASYGRLYWGLNVPLGTSATTHSGTTTFTAI